MLRELGETIDIHGGGRDLVFPHHECETAQSEAVTGEQFVRLWFHVGLVGLDGTKMSKSLGNLVFVGDLCKEWDPAAVRLALLGHHYREDWDWRTDEDMPAAAARLALWRSAPPAAVAVAVAVARRGWRPCGPRSMPTSTRPPPCARSTKRPRPGGRWPMGRASSASPSERDRGRGGGPVPLGHHERCPDQEQSAG